jgi:UDP-N-acetylmuramoyl-L-alanyl-D-glutamate--2,6-diaminopimelate ligase
LFFALAGSQSHGLEHAAQAAAAGVCAVVYDPSRGGAELAATVEVGVPLLPVERLDQAVGFIADRFFGQPSLSMNVVGVTGTNGKTSCSHFLAHALGGGAPSAVIGTLGWGVPWALKPTTHTTPDAIEIHALLAKLSAEGVASVAMEASSHGLDQGRLNGVRFAGALFTNWSRDHLDYHQDMEAYLEAKLRLVGWPGLKFIVFNLDDASSAAIAERAPAGARKIGFSLAGKSAPGPGVEIVHASDIRHGQGGVAFDVRFAGNKARVAAPLYGDFNVENLLGAVAVLLALGFDIEASARRLGSVRAVPGRMERFAGAAGPVAVVDYAHTPDALRKALASLRRHCRGSLWVVFGCGGDRDRGKRPLMGAIAETLADRVVLTDDNPRSEDGGAIIRDVLEGCVRQDAAVVMRDRRQAIAWALERLREGDVLLVAGKGHEDTQDIGGVKQPFSDRVAVRQLLGLPEEEAVPCA